MFGISVLIQFFSKMISAAGGEGTEKNFFEINCLEGNWGSYL